MRLFAEGAAAVWGRVVDLAVAVVIGFLRWVGRLSSRLGLERASARDVPVLAGRAQGAAMEGVCASWPAALRQNASFFTDRR